MITRQKIRVTCRGKTYHASKRDAAAARNAIMHGKRRHDRPDHLAVYHCPHCNGWHLTSQEDAE